MRTYLGDWEIPEAVGFQARPILNQGLLPSYMSLSLPWEHCLFLPIHTVAKVDLVILEGLLAGFKVCDYSCTMEVQQPIPVLKKAYGDSMHKVLHIGPDTCTVVSKLCSEEETEAWGVDPYDVEDADRSCKALVRKGGLCKDGLYPLSLSSESTVLHALSSVDSSLWHNGLGHPSSSVLAPLGSTLGSTLSFNSFCNNCALSKSHQLPFPSNHISASSVFSIIHSDVWMSPTLSVTSFKYYVLFTDEYSPYTWLYPMHQKNEVLTHFQSLVAMICNIFHNFVQYLQSDNDTEYVNNVFSQFCASSGIQQRFSCPYTPQQNGLAERKHRHIATMARTLLLTLGAPQNLWADAFFTSVYLINLLPTPTLNWDTPHTRLYGHPPPYSSLRVFGCSCFPILGTNVPNKLSSRSVEYKLIHLLLPSSSLFSPIELTLYLLRPSCRAQCHLAHSQLITNLSNLPFLSLTAQPNDPSLSSQPIDPIPSLQPNAPSSHSGQNPPLASLESDRHSINLVLPLPSSPAQLPSSQPPGRAPLVAPPIMTYCCRHRPVDAPAQSTIARAPHLIVAKRILHYVKGTLGHGLHFSPQSQPAHLYAYSVVDWADCPESRRSTSDYLIYLGNTLVSWCSKKQPTIARSSVESEYRSLAHSSAETTWLGFLLYELSFHIQYPILLYCDNLSATYMASNPVFHARTKHIELDYHFVREKVALGSHQVHFVPSVDHPADLLTKPLHKQCHNLLCTKLVRPEPPSLKGGVRENHSPPLISSPQLKLIVPKSFSVVIVLDSLDYLSERYLNKTLLDLARVSADGVVIFTGKILCQLVKSIYLCSLGKQRAKAVEVSKFGRVAKLRNKAWWTKFFGQVSLEENEGASKKFNIAATKMSFVSNCQVFHLRSFN
ncbi:putative RNA-directed DNA polymerase [Rosa chinensis]|uniref:Putative RNA-directed DNA polymerase n=1 Tax=Rosa chinensis TaxID=74649 RepID=A0A2P6Q149_ROSCH|nr:putative RNA-directed DNA polymerase [Rosa chinensis]